MRTFVGIPCLVCFAFLLIGAEAASGQRLLIPDDYYSIATPADPQVSPDEKLVTYTVTAIDRKTNRRRSVIWLAPLDGSGEPRQFTTMENSSRPRWSPDGRTVAFLSARPDPQTGTQEKSQVYLLPMNGGEARRVTDLKNDVSWFEWSPDGTRLVCVSKIGPSDNVVPGTATSDVRHYTNAAYKLDGVGWYDDRNAHIWIVDVSTGKARQITFGNTRNVFEPQWSPDGSRIAYLAENTQFSPRLKTELWVAGSNGENPVRILAPPTYLISLRWSHDGRQLAYIGASDETNIPKIYISPAAGGPFHTINNEVTFPTSLEWTADGSAIDFTQAFRGEQRLFRLNLKSGQPTPLISNISIRQPAIGKVKHQLVYVAGDDVHPDDVFVADSNGANPRQITHLNRGLLADVDLRKMERLTFRGPENWEIEGFFLKPAGWQAGKTYPMVLMLHGGPNGMWGPQWNFEVRAHAARGCAVLLINHRGSSGYGEAFQRGVEKEWGGKAYEDIMAGVDAAIAKYSWIDRNRLGVMGQSFGGYMTDWIVGQTHRFKAAVSLSGISDLVSVQGTRDAHYGHSKDFGGDLWQNFDLYWKYSPIRNAKNVKTPTLILHGENDHRVPLAQGEEFFRALNHYGVPAEFVIFPREGHSLRSEPRHAVEVLKWQIYWFERYLDGNSNAKRPTDD